LGGDESGCSRISGLTVKAGGEAQRLTPVLRGRIAARSLTLLVRVL
jgi:hypothetical protein